MYMYICVCICMYVYVYIYTLQSFQLIHQLSIYEHSVKLNVSVHVYIYIYIYTSQVKNNGKSRGCPHHSETLSLQTKRLRAPRRSLISRSFYAVHLYCKPMSYFRQVIAIISPPYRYIIYPLGISCHIPSGNLT